MTWKQDVRGNTQYPYECSHSAPVCGRQECGEGWSQFDPAKGSLRHARSSSEFLHQTEVKTGYGLMADDDKARSELEEARKQALRKLDELRLQMEARPVISKAVGMKGVGTGFQITPSDRPQALESYCLDITMPPQVPWTWRLWRVLCLPWDILVFIKTGRLKFLTILLALTLTFSILPASQDCPNSAYCPIHHKTAYWVGYEYRDGRCFCKYHHMVPDHDILESCPN